jgi:hypothetical protein
MRDKKEVLARGSFRKLQRACRDEARHGEVSGGGGARVRELSTHMLIKYGEELTLYIGPTLSKLGRWD